MPIHSIHSLMIRSLRVIPVIFLLMALFTFGDDALGKPLYSYSDEKGTRVITDDYGRIPPQYRARVTAVEQEAEPSEGTSAGRQSASDRVSGLFYPGNGFVIDIPGMSFEQSKVITYAGALAVFCILVMNLSSGQGLRTMALWCLIMTAICAPVLIYVSDDGAGTTARNKAAQLQQKQQDHLKYVP